MGSYINPHDCSKEDWLLANAEILGLMPPRAMPPPGKLPVCHVNNGDFTAAGICFNEGELRAFSREDGRDKAWFLVETKKLLDEKVSDLRFFLK